MRFSIGRFRIELTITDRREPWELGLISRRRLAEEILTMAEARGDGHKIDRIRELRQMSIDRDWSNFGLRDAKEWVESAFAENGAGAIL